jgi:very-short-patch-repair endonuclease
MRSVMTDAESRLWNEIRAHRLMGLGFRRQFPIGGYIVDFACPDKRLIVEVDGSQHAEGTVSVADAARSETLRRDGWTILRFWNGDVLHDIDNVCLHIVTVAGLTAADAALYGEMANAGADREARP